MMIIIIIRWWWSDDDEDDGDDDDDDDADDDPGTGRACILHHNYLRNLFHLPCILGYIYSRSYFDSHNNESDCDNSCHTLFHLATEKKDEIMNT
jgi:hypothetical protein